MAISGNISETSGITTWRVSAAMCSDNSSAGTTTSTGTTYSLTTTQTGAALVSITPKIDYVWSAGKVAVVGDFVVPTDIASAGYLYVCTTAGTTNTVEPFWISSGTIADNSVVWTFVDRLVNPITKIMVI
jgi:hypothetical protein